MPSCSSPASTRPASASGSPTRSARWCTAVDVLQVVTGLGETGNALCRARIDKLAFTGSGRDRQAGHGGLRREPHAGDHRGRRQGLADRRRGRRPAEGGRGRAVGRDGQRRPDLHRHRARLRPRERLRRLHDRDPRPGRGAARRGRLRRADRADHDAVAARRHQEPHRRRDRQGRQGGARRRRRSGRALRAADDPHPRARGLHRRSPRRPSGPTLAINPVASMDEAVRLTNATDVRPRRRGVRQEANGLSTSPAASAPG